MCAMGSAIEPIRDPLDLGDMNWPIHHAPNTFLQGWSRAVLGGQEASPPLRSATLTAVHAAPACISACSPNGDGHVNGVDM